MINKEQLAHEMAIAMQSAEPITDMKMLAALTWSYADAMQAESEKRKPKGVPEAIKERPIFLDENGNCGHLHTTFGRTECFDCGAKLNEFKIDWSLAPDGFNWWAFDGSTKRANWYKTKPYLSDDSDGDEEWDIEINGHCYEQAPSFNFTGNWKDSLTERPNE